MKKTPLRKVSKSSISILQKKIWALCREISLERYKKLDGSISCYTCNSQNLEGPNRQLGHMWAKASLGAYLKYDLRILRWQCGTCNQFRGGMGADFYKRMLEETSPLEMMQLIFDRQVTVKAYDHYLSLLEKYTKMKKDLGKDKG